MPFKHALNSIVGTLFYGDPSPTHQTKQSGKLDSLNPNKYQMESKPKSVEERVQYGNFSTRLPSPELIPPRSNQRGFIPQPSSRVDPTPPRNVQSNNTAKYIYPNKPPGDPSVVMRNKPTPGIIPPEIPPRSNQKGFTPPSSGVVPGNVCCCSCYPNIQPPLPPRNRPMEEKPKPSVSEPPKGLPLLDSPEECQSILPDSNMKPDVLENPNNSNLKTELEMSARTVSFQSEEIQRLLDTITELNQKLKNMSLENDELTRNLANSRDMALTITNGFHQVESKLKKEITELKDKLNSKQKILEGKELESINLQDKRVAAQKGEEKANKKLQLAQDKNLILTNQNEQLENELTELERKMDQISDEFRHLSEAEARDAPSVKVAWKLADERAAENGLLQTEVSRLKRELAVSQKSVQLFKPPTWAVTESQLRKEIEDLKATIQTQNETLLTSTLELERIKHDDSFLSISLESERAILAHKCTENDDLKIRNSDLENDNTLLELNNRNLKEEVEDFRLKLEQMERQNQDLLDTREAVLQSEKLAEEKVAALSEALAALREAITHIKDAAEATKTEREAMDSGAPKGDRKKGNWIKKLMLGKSKTQKCEDDGYANLLETTGLKMVERAKNLQDHADKIKEIGKRLKKKAKTLQK